MWFVTTQQNHSGLYLYMHITLVLKNTSRQVTLHKMVSQVESIAPW